MKTVSSLETQVRDFIITTYLPDADPTDLSNDTHLVESGIIDSIRVLSLVEFMEEEYDLMIEPQDLFRLISVHEIARVIREKAET